MPAFPPPPAVPNTSPLPRFFPLLLRARLPLTRPSPIALVLVVAAACTVNSALPTGASAHARSASAASATSSASSASTVGGSARRQLIGGAAQRGNSAATHGDDESVLSFQQHHHRPRLLHEPRRGGVRERRGNCGDYTGACRAPGGGSAAAVSTAGGTGGTRRGNVNPVGGGGDSCTGGKPGRGGFGARDGRFPDAGGGGRNQRRGVTKAQALLRALLPSALSPLAFRAPGGSDDGGSRRCRRVVRLSGAHYRILRSCAAAAVETFPRVAVVPAAPRTAVLRVPRAPFVPPDPFVLRFLAFRAAAAPAIPAAAAAAAPATSSRVATGFASVAGRRCQGDRRGKASGDSARRKEQERRQPWGEEQCGIVDRAAVAAGSVRN
ncbi:unnamed protein product [Closterium sp. NIES-54]